MAARSSHSSRHKRLCTYRLHFLISLSIFGMVAAIVAAVLLLTPEEVAAVQQGQAMPQEALPTEYEVNCITGSIPKEIFSKEFPQFSLDSFTYRCNKTPYWKDGVLHDLYLENPKGNFYNMQADLTRKDGALLYCSGIITPMQYVEQLPMEQAPAEDSVKAQLTIRVFKDSETEKPAAVFTEEIEILVINN